MTYPYSEQNLFEKPQKYMYTPFQGVEFIQSYLNSRHNVLSLCRKSIPNTPYCIIVKKAFTVIEHVLIDKSPNAAKNFCPQLKLQIGKGLNSNSQDELQLTQMNEVMKSVSPGKVVATSNVLDGLVASLLAENADSDYKIWLDRLVQRFEVSKKLYEEYQPGFRKGQGENKSIILYWLFALTLCLYYIKTNHLKYLSTLIKINDLLTSLPLEDLFLVIPTFGMELVLSTEIISVTMLAEAKGVEYASK